MQHQKSSLIGRIISVQHNTRQSSLTVQIILVGQVQRQKKLLTFFAHIMALEAQYNTRQSLLIELIIAVEDQCNTGQSSPYQ
jgi:hypothetical protein